jgi:hypothetical protein
MPGWCGRTLRPAPIVLGAIAANAIELVIFAGDTLQKQPETLVAIAWLSVALDSVWKHSGTRNTRASPASGDAG